MNANIPVEMRGLYAKCAMEQYSNVPFPFHIFQIEIVELTADPIHEKVCGGQACAVVSVFKTGQVEGIISVI